MSIYQGKEYKNQEKYEKIQNLIKEIECLDIDINAVISQTTKKDTRFKQSFRLANRRKLENFGDSLKSIVEYLETISRAFN